MKTPSMKVTRRAFGLGALGGVSLSASAALDYETHKALGLDRPFTWSEPINGNRREDFARFMSPPGDGQYHPCGEAHPAADTPRGSVRQFEGWSESRVFPQTRRDIWIYLPAQLGDSTEPPDLMVFQDGGGYVAPDGPVRAPAVLDTLIANGELRPTVGVFINPGTRDVPRADDDPDLGQQRSVEYDTLTDAYVRFVLSEALPFVEKTIGRRLSRDPERRTICGISSGGICAFTAAWFRPDPTRSVVSSVTAARSSTSAADTTTRTS